MGVLRAGRLPKFGHTQQAGYRINGTTYGLDTPTLTEGSRWAEYPTDWIPRRQIEESDRVAYPMESI